MKVPTFGISLFSVLAAASAAASWLDVPLEQVIRQSQVVVIGELTRITPAPAPPPENQRQQDVGHIRVEEVLLNSLTNRVVEPKQELPLSMPSSRNRLRVSTDIHYKAGTRGVWILEFKDGVFWATYPKDFQPMTAEREVRDIIRRIRAQDSDKP